MEYNKFISTSSATDMNEHSSRSHAIFIVTIECSDVSAEYIDKQLETLYFVLVDVVSDEHKHIIVTVHRMLIRYLKA